MDDFDILADVILEIPSFQGSDLPVLLFLKPDQHGKLGGYHRIDVVPVKYAQPREFVEFVHADVPLLLSTA